MKYGLLVTYYLGWKEVLHDLYFYIFIMWKTEIQVRNHNAWERTTRWEKWHSTYLIVTPSKEDILFNTQTPQKTSSRTEQSLRVWKKYTPNVSPLPPQYYQTQHFWPQRCGFSTHQATLCNTRELGLHNWNLTFLREAHWLKLPTLTRHYHNHLCELFYDRRS